MIRHCNLLNTGCWCLPPIVGRCTYSYRAPNKAVRLRNRYCFLISCWRSMERANRLRQLQAKTPDDARRHSVCSWQPSSAPGPFACAIRVLSSRLIFLGLHVAQRPQGCLAARRQRRLAAALAAGIICYNPQHHVVWGALELRHGVLS